MSRAAVVRQAPDRQRPNRQPEFEQDGEEVFPNGEGDSQCLVPAITQP